MANATPTGKISTQELVKSTRDAVVVSLGLLIPQLLTLAEQTDFGLYNVYASIILGIVAPLINRYLNGWRV